MLIFLTLCKLNSGRFFFCLFFFSCQLLGFLASLFCFYLIFKFLPLLLFCFFFNFALGIMLFSFSNKAQFRFSLVIKFFFFLLFCSYWRNNSFFTHFNLYNFFACTRRCFFSQTFQCQGLFSR